MAKYVLGAGAARKLQEMMRGRMKSGRINGDVAHMVDESEFAHPYRLTYAADAGSVDGETGEAAGAWIIWLPDGCLVIDGEKVDLTEDMTAATNYPSGWYDLTGIFDGTDPDDFELYLDASKDDPKFVLDPDDAENPVLIAQVDGKAVKGVVESAIVFSKGGSNKKPFDIETVMVSGSPVKKVVRCVWMPGGNIVTSSDLTLSEITGGSTVYVVVRQVMATTSTATLTVEQVASGSVPQASTGVTDQFVQYAPIYDLSETLDVVVDYRDALVGLNWIGLDNNSISYGDDGNSQNFLHLKDFYNSDSNQSVIPTGCMLLARVPAIGGTYTLAYVPTSLFVVTGGGSGGGSSQTSGYTGDVVLGTLPRYDDTTHKLLYTPVTLTFADGLLQSMVAADSETEITTAVEETA